MPDLVTVILRGLDTIFGSAGLPCWWTTRSCEGAVAAAGFQQVYTAPLSWRAACAGLLPCVCHFCVWLAVWDVCGRST